MPGRPGSSSTRPHADSPVEERHLHVQLGELGLAVGPQSLVAEAAGELVVPVEARDHEQLLEELGRLWQGVEITRGEAGGDEEVAGPLRGGLPWGGGGGEVGARPCRESKEAMSTPG